MSKEQVLANYIESFRQKQASLNGDGNATTQEAQRKAAESFASLGFPTTKHEEWKYTNMASLATSELAAYTAYPTEIPQSFEQYQEVDAYRLVFVNGHFIADLSELPELEGLEVISLKEARKQNHSELESHFNTLANNADESFTALNTAFAQDGALIHVKAGKMIEKPIMLLYLSTDEAQGQIANIRNLVIAEQATELRLLEAWENLGNSQAVVNCMSELCVGNAANVYWDSVQTEDNIQLINSKQAGQKGGSQFTNTIITLNGQLVRNNVNTTYYGEHCDANLHGLYYVKNKDLVDNHVLVDHAKAKSTSNQLFKGVMDDQGTGVFNGKIYVKPDAQQTNAYQSNKNILLSDRATINTKPQLEIFADDVKCSHGATSGQLDEQAIFYLQARGISKAKAKALMTYAFASEVIQKLKSAELRAKLEKSLQESLDISL